VHWREVTPHRDGVSLRQAHRAHGRQPGGGREKAARGEEPVYTLDVKEIARLRASRNVPSERLLVELAKSLF